MDFKVVPIPERIAAEARSLLVSPQYKSLKANVSAANGYGPCRSCLRVFDQRGENRIYFTYNAFEGRSDLPDPGPVFIHEERCAGFDGSGIPADLLHLPILLEAFGEESRLVTRQPIQAGNAGEQIETIFADRSVKFINLRNAESGCFIATVERA